MNSPDDLKTLRLLRERVLKRDEPRVRPLEDKDAWVLYAAYDLGSFPKMPKGLKPAEVFSALRAWRERHSSVVIIEANHKYFREKRGPVAMVTIDNFGWQIEPQVDFFFWATPRQRLSAVVGFLHMTRWSREVGVCVVKVAEKDKDFCEHLYKYDLLRPLGKLPNAREEGAEYLYFLKGRREKKSEEQPMLKAA